MLIQWKAVNLFMKIFLIENNKLIAEFMKLEKYHSSAKEWLKNKCIYSDEELPYNSDWNWLMEVVEKISEIPLDDAESNDDMCYPRTFGMKDDVGRYMVRFNGCGLCFGEDFIESVYNACVEFIKWYNQNKKADV